MQYSQLKGTFEYFFHKTFFKPDEKNYKKLKINQQIKLNSETLAIELQEDTDGDFEECDLDIRLGAACQEIS